MENKDRKILIVDDDPKNVKLLSAALRSWGYGFEEAGDGAAALEKVRAYRPDLVLMDVMMPVMDGYEACAAIKADPESRGVPVVMVTAMADRNSRLKGLEAGADDYLSKPIDIIELEVRVRNLLIVKSHHDLMKRYNEDLERTVKEKARDITTILGAIRALLIGTDTSGRVIYWNAAATDILEVPAESAMGRTLDAAVPGLDAAMIKNATDRAASRMTRIDLEDIRYTAASGANKILGITISPMVDDGRTGGFLVHGADITDRRVMEAQLIQTSKMAAIGEVATGIAHEINQPLNVINMAAQLIQQHMDKGPINGEFVNDRLDKITSSVQRASRIIDHLRTFGRKEELKLVPLDPRVPIRAAFDFLSEQMKSHGITPVLEMDGETTLIRGDANRLEQVFINLITNARDALDAASVPDKKIRIALGKESGRKRLRILFSDNGPGIPADVIPRIFDPFFTTKETGKGTGLGLSICYGIIKSHNGTITARTDGGAVFAIELPVAE